EARIVDDDLDALRGEPEARGDDDPARLVLAAARGDGREEAVLVGAGDVRLVVGDTLGEALDVLGAADRPARVAVGALDLRDGRGRPERRADPAEDRLAGRAHRARHQSRKLSSGMSGSSRVRAQPASGPTAPSALTGPRPRRASRWASS